LRLRIVSIWLRWFWRELRLEISDLSFEIAGERLSPFGFFEEDDPMGIAPWRPPAAF
jgi:hypothetical protein